jgi:Tol biopolymer transport system component
MCRPRGTAAGSCSGRRIRRPPPPTFSEFDWAIRCPWLVATPATELYPALSPDGRWLAYSSDESGAFEVYVRPFPETAGAKWQVSTAGGSQPIWSSTGRELIYVNGKNEMVSAEIPSGTTFSVGAQRTLFSVQQFAAVGAVPGYWLAPDDKRFLVLREGGRDSRESWSWRRTGAAAGGCGGEVTRLVASGGS